MHYTLINPKYLIMAKNNNIPHLPALRKGDVGSSLILYHGTNRRIANLNVESFLTTKIEEAVFFAENKGGGMVYQFNVKQNEVYRDTGTPQAEWYLSVKKLKPIRCWSV